MVIMIVFRKKRDIKYYFWENIAITFMSFFIGGFTVLCVAVRLCS